MLVSCIFDVENSFKFAIISVSSENYKGTNQNFHLFILCQLKRESETELSGCPVAWYNQQPAFTFEMNKIV